MVAQGCEGNAAMSDEPAPLCCFACWGEDRFACERHIHEWAAKREIAGVAHIAYVPTEGGIRAEVYTYG